MRDITKLHAPNCIGFATYREVKALVMSEIESLGKEFQLKYYEQVKVSHFFVLTVSHSIQI